jgi:hypothetical protein
VIVSKASARFLRLRRVFPTATTISCMDVYSFSRFRTCTARPRVVPFDCWLTNSRGRRVEWARCANFALIDLWTLWRPLVHRSTCRVRQRHRARLQQEPKTSTARGHLLSSLKWSGATCSNQRRRRYHTLRVAEQHSHLASVCGSAEADWQRDRSSQPGPARASRARPTPPAAGCRIPRPGNLLRAAPSSARSRRGLPAKRPDCDPRSCCASERWQLGKARQGKAGTGPDVAERRKGNRRTEPRPASEAKPTR